MNDKTGIWIDTRRAVLIFLSDDAHRVQVVESGIETRERIPGEGKWFARFGTQFFNFNRRKQARQQAEINRYLGRVADAVKGLGAVVIFGPAGMKKQLHRYLQEKIINPPVVKGVEHADGMTQKQMVAWVKTYFQEAAVH